jgi:hypothetical protein
MSKPLEQIADILRKSGCYVASPGEWPKDTPACDLHLATNIRTILSRSYRNGEAPGDLTPKSFKGGGLTVDDLAKDFKHHQSQLEDLHLMGPRWMRELKEALETTGALNKE